MSSVATCPADLARRARLSGRRPLIPDVQALDFLLYRNSVSLLLCRSRRPPHHQVNDQEHDSNHE